MKWRYKQALLQALLHELYWWVHICNMHARCTQAHQANCDCICLPKTRPKDLQAPQQHLMMNIHMTPALLSIQFERQFCEICGMLTIWCVSIDNKIRCTLQLCLDSREHQRSVLQIHFILMYPAAVLDYAPEHLHSVLWVSHAALPPGCKLTTN